VYLTALPALVLERPVLLLTFEILVVLPPAFLVLVTVRLPLSIVVVKPAFFRSPRAPALVLVTTLPLSRTVVLLRDLEPSAARLRVTVLPALLVLDTETDFPPPLVRVIVLVAPLLVVRVRVRVPPSRVTVTPFSVVLVLGAIALVLPELFLALVLEALLLFILDDSLVVLAAVEVVVAELEALFLRLAFAASLCLVEATDLPFSGLYIWSRIATRTGDKLLLVYQTTKTEK